MSWTFYPLAVNQRLGVLVSPKPECKPVAAAFLTPAEAKQRQADEAES